MKILIDATPIPRNKSGVGNYAVNLIREIARQDTCNTYFVLIQSDESVFDEKGFGIPVLEALSLGVPTITSNVSSMPEVAGDAAWLVDPLSVGELSDALRELLGNPALRQELSFRGIEQAKKFSWKKTAMETIAVYGDALRSVQ